MAIECEGTATTLSPLNRTLIIGGLFSVVGDCLSTIAQYLDDIGQAHAVHFQQQQERAFERAARREIGWLTDATES